MRDDASFWFSFWDEAAQSIALQKIPPGNRQCIRPDGPLPGYLRNGPRDLRP